MKLVELCNKKEELYTHRSFLHLNVTSDSFLKLKAKKKKKNPRLSWNRKCHFCNVIRWWDCGVQGHDFVWFLGWLSAFRKDLLPPSTLKVETEGSSKMFITTYKTTSSRNEEVHNVYRLFVIVYVALSISLKRLVNTSSSCFYRTRSSKAVFSSENGVLGRLWCAFVYTYVLFHLMDLTRTVWL
jgi:hypothetical protein